MPTRPRTTQTPGNRTNAERNRARPSYNRSKSRFTTTTTESYHESSYEPTRAKTTPETTQKSNAIEHRRPASRTHKYRNRDRTSSQPAVRFIPRFSRKSQNLERQGRLERSRKRSSSKFLPGARAKRSTDNWL